MSASAAFGPWRADIPTDERLARLRAMRAIVFMLCGPHHPLVIALAAAETEPSATEEALRQLEQLPPLRRRRVLSVYAALQTSRRGKSDV